jgi:colicin import membrane protein
VVAARENRVLDDRAKARDDYHALEKAGGEWAPPLFIRQDMDAWKFTEAETGMTAATAVLDRLPALDDLLAKAELTISPDIEKAYESATENLDAVGPLIDADTARAQKAIDDKAAAEKKAAEEKAAAEKAEADRQAELARQRAATGQLIADARAKRAGADGFFEKLGLDGKGVDALLDEADRLLAADQFDQANAQVQAAEAKIDDASGKGKTKAFTVGGIGLGGVVLLSGLGLVLVRGKRKRKRAALPPDVTPDQPAQTEQTEQTEALRPPELPAWPAPVDSPDE